MEITPQIPADRQLIQSYRPGGFKVSGKIYRGSLLVFPDRIAAWPVAAPAEMALADFALVREAEPDVELLVVGLGAFFTLFPQALRQELRQWGIVVEAMATPAACRTYNLLMAEDRRVAAALIALEAPSR